MKVREVVRMLEAEGWRLKRQKGSHRHFVSDSVPGKVTVNGHPGDELAPGTLLGILKQAGLRK